MVNLDELISKRIRVLASQIFSSADRQVARLLVEVSDALKDSNSSAVVKRVVWDLGLFEVVLHCLRQECSLPSLGWPAVSVLVDLACQLCTGMSVSDDVEKNARVEEEMIPQVWSLCLRFAHKMTAEMKTNIDALGAFERTLEALRVLLSYHVQVVPSVVESHFFLILFLHDDPRASLAMTSLFLSVLRQVGELKVQDETLFTLLDELVFQLTGQDDASLAAMTVQTLLFLVEGHPPMLQRLRVRYRGLDFLLRRWTGRVSPASLRRLIVLLKLGDEERAEMQRLSESASLIQSLWKGFRLRRQLAKAGKAFSRLQRNVRRRQQERQQEKAQRMVQMESALVDQVRRLHALRQMHQKHFALVNSAAPSDVGRVLVDIQVVATMRVQAWYRGCLVRRQMARQRRAATEFRAIVTIQRWIRRKWRLRAARASSSRPVPRALIGDSRRIELQRQVEAWQRLHPSPDLARLPALHAETQELLRKFVLTRATQARRQLHRDAVLAQCQLDLDLLRQTPPLDAGPPSTDLFAYSLPVATAARTSHLQALEALRMPWWKQLRSEPS